MNIAESAFRLGNKRNDQPETKISQKPMSAHSKNNQTTGSEGKRELTNGMIV